MEQGVLISAEFEEQELGQHSSYLIHPDSYTDQYFLT